MPRCWPALWACVAPRPAGAEASLELRTVGDGEAGEERAGGDPPARESLLAAQRFLCHSQNTEVTVPSWPSGLV